MAQGYIRLEIDPDDYEKVRSQLYELYNITSRAGLIVEKIENIQSTFFPGFVVGFVCGLIISAIFAFVLFLVLR